MEKSTKIIIGISTGVAVSAALVLLYMHAKKKKAATANSSPGAAPATGNNLLLDPGNTRIGGANGLRATAVPASQLVGGDVLNPNNLRALLTGASGGTTAAPATDSVPMTSNNYLLWSSAIIKKLNDTGNTSIAYQLNNYLKAAANGDQVSGNFYALDTNPYYNKSVPTLTLNGGGSGISPKQCFDTCISVLCLIAKNYVQANTNGQAIGSRQGIINTAYNNVMSNDSINNIPQSAAACMFYYNCAITGNWPVGNGGGALPPADATSQILSAVGSATKIVALFL